ncbi:MAG: efflux transporter outer membrane subunit [Isosphaeraceae bacterium]|jgi:NodT family efflux transporter outer membrane factor (OMF) lipoprotein
MSHPVAARSVRLVLRGGPALLAVLALMAAGCTPLKEWVHNGFKVGPNFEDPPAAVATDWIDAADPRLIHGSAADSAWWNVFEDLELNSLIATAYRQNLDLRTVGTRVLQAQAQRNIEVGNLFPQTQNAIADYAHAQIGSNLSLFNNPRAQLPSNLNIWATGFNASWELDLWGRLRRSIESANADRDSAVEAYHDTLVILTADVATNYVQIRTVQQRIAYAGRNVEIQRGSLRLAEARLRDGKATALDVKQARSSLAQTESSLPPLAISLRQANNRLCVLLGLPPHDLTVMLGEAPIPATPPEAAVGIPAQLLQHRPDVRRALREAAAQSARIGVAEADFYPQIGVTGFLGYAASDLRHLLAEQSFTGLILPTFSWKILNYGRVLNNVRNQDARFQEKVFQYQQTVLKAGQEVEDALVAFLQYQLQARSLEVAVQAAQDSVVLVQAQYQGGLVDFNRVFTAQAQLVTQQDQLAIARGNIASSLIAVYRALGGGWQAVENCRAPALYRT